MKPAQCSRAAQTIGQRCTRIVFLVFVLGVPSFQLKKKLTSAHVQVLPIKAWDKNDLKFLDIPFLPLENNYKGSEPHQRRQCRPFSCAEQNLSGGGRANAIEQNVCLYDSDTLWTENILHSSASVIRDQPKSFILQNNPDNSTSKTKSNTVKKLSNGNIH